MKTETSKVLLLVACAGLLVAGAIFLCLTMFGGRDGWTLPAALGCLVLSGLFGLVYSQIAGKHDEEKSE